MCCQPQVHFQCGCIKPRPVAEIPTREHSSLVRIDDGRVYKLCHLGKCNQEPCEARFIETHEACSARVNTLCADCLAKAYGQPLSVTNPPKRNTNADLEAFEDNGEVCKKLGRKSSFGSIVDPFQSLWEHAKTLKSKKLPSHGSNENVSQNF